MPGCITLSAVLVERMPQPQGKGTREAEERGGQEGGEREESRRGGEEGKAGGEAELSWEMRLSLETVPGDPPLLPSPKNPTPATPTFSCPGKRGKYLKDLPSLSYPGPCHPYRHVIMQSPSSQTAHTLQVCGRHVS